MHTWILGINLKEKFNRNRTLSHNLLTSILIESLQKFLALCSHSRRQSIRPSHFQWHKARSWRQTLVTVWRITNYSWACLIFFFFFLKTSMTGWHNHQPNVICFCFCPFCSCLPQVLVLCKWWKKNILLLLAGSLIMHRKQNLFQNTLKKLFLLKTLWKPKNAAVLFCCEAPVMCFGQRIILFRQLKKWLRFYMNCSSK